MNRFATCALIAAGLTAGTSAHAALSVAADYTFDDGTDLVAAGFTVNGDAAISGNQLVLDGAGDFLQIADPLAGANDNIVVEAVVTINSGAGFSFVAGRNTETGNLNNGHGILVQAGNIANLQSGVGTAGVGVAEILNQEITVSIVRQGGENSLWIDGVQVSGPTAVNFNGTPDTLTVGGHGFDVPAGTLNGSINRLRLSTIDAADVLGADAGNDNFITVVPEPSSLALLGLGGLMIARRRRG